jgi:hypothetical protein
LSNLSRLNKDDDEKEQMIKDNNSGVINLNNINLNNSKDYYYKNKKKNFIPINEINDNNYYNKNNINKSQIHNFNNSFTVNNNTNKFSNNFLPPQSNFIISDNPEQNNNHKRIINQNCYQINIENMNIHNSINNISQNYNISTINENDNNNNKNNISIEFKQDNNTSNISKISYNSMSLSELLNNIDKVSENQSGCRLLQNKLQQNSNHANDFYRALEVKKILKKMTIDSFGNYLIQKLLEYITNDIIQEFFTNIIIPSFMEISLNPHGSRVIQKLLGRIYNTSLMIKFNDCLENSMLEIFLNQSSTHIIIKYISLIKYPNNTLIYKFIVNNIKFIATHKHSCCTLQKCLEEGNSTQRKEILMSLANISNILFADRYGNYAIQFALSLKDEEANKIIISQYLNNFQKNISNKISSNVYEKVLEYCDFNTKQYIIKSLCNFETVKSLLYDTYGNYVLQKTLLASNEPYRSMYIKFIAPLIDGLKNFPNGLIIIHKIISHFPELQSYVQLNTNKNRNYNMYNNNNMKSMNNNFNNNINNNMNNNMNLNNMGNNIHNNNYNINNNNYIPFTNGENKMMYQNNNNNYY